MSSESVCVMDFCGRCGPYYPVNMWADWQDGVTRFGGAWCELPDLHSETPPEEETLENWATQHKAPFAWNPDTKSRLDWVEGSGWHKAYLGEDG